MLLASDVFGLSKARSQSRSVGGYSLTNKTFVFTSAGQLAVSSYNQKYTFFGVLSVRRLREIGNPLRAATIALPLQEK